jgi:P-type Cu2+ transporter
MNQEGIGNHEGGGGSSGSGERHGDPAGEKHQGVNGGNGHGAGHGGHGGGGSHHAHMARDFRNRFWACLALTVPVLLLSPLLRETLGLENVLSFTGDEYVLFAFSAVIFAYGGWPFLKGMERELRDRQPGMMTLIALAITVAFAYSSVVVFGVSGKLVFWELATLVDIMLLGHWLEMRSVIGASRALEDLVKLLPDEAHLVTGGGDIRDVPLSELEAGDVVQIRPGEKVPVDGKVVEGETGVNEAMLTGETREVFKGNGDEVIGGSVNGDGSIRVEIEKTGADTYLSQVIELVEKSRESRSRTQDLADRAATLLTIIAISAGAITLAVWLIAGKAFEFSLERTVTVMVITCPHALGLAIPLVVAVSTTLAAREGLLIRDRSAFERSRNLKAVVFDKTGTLTEGRFGVSEVVPLAEGIDEEAVLSLAAAVEADSEHAIARGIVGEAEERGMSLRKAEDFKSIPGRGARATVDGQEVLVVGPGYLDAEGIELPEENGGGLESRGETVVYVLGDGEPVGAISLEDVIRDQSREAVSRLKERGLECMMVTGDNERVASWVAEELGLDDFFAAVPPDEKSEKIRELKDRGLTVAMVGDGVNDAPALAEADLGVAIGAGTDVAIESADIVLARNDPGDVINIVDLSSKTYRKMLQNLGWATGYNVFAIPAAAGALYPLGILLSPAVGAVLMSLSTVIVAVNARFLKLNKEYEV